MTDRNAAPKPSIFVVTAGVSVRGNLTRLGSYRSESSDGSVTTLFSDCLAFIGPVPPRRDPIVEVAEALGLEATSGGQTRNTPSLTEANPSSPSVSCGESVDLQRVADLLPPEEGRSSTRGLSAELSSMFADDAPHPQPGDHVVLLTSDSEVGVRCAAVVGMILHAFVGGVYQRVDVGNTVADQGLRCGVDSFGDVDSGQLAGALDGGGVTVAVVGGLTADEEFAVARSGWGIARVLGSAYAAARLANRRLVLHPIGGYKATIPQFTALAAHLPTGHEVDVEMWSNHETASIGLRQPLLRIGVPDAEYWDLQELTQSQTVDADEASGGRPVRLRSSRWDDYAWDHSGDDGNDYQLTDVGRAIVELRAACRRESGSPRGK